MFVNPLPVSADFLFYRAVGIHSGKDECMETRIRSLIAIIAILLSCAASAEAVPHFVSGNGSDMNSGLSWFFAKRTISSALADTAPGDEIWVSAATYHEHISIPNGVKVYGGFFG